MGEIILRGDIFTGTSDGSIPDGAVVVADGKIRAVGPASTILSDSAGAEVIDFAGKTIIPGLFDLHAHFSPILEPEFEEGLSERVLSGAVCRGVWNARRALVAGCTTARDAGCMHRGIYVLAEWVAAGNVPGPRIFASGAALACTGGHGHDSCALQYDGPDAMRRGARDQLRLGAEYIKIMATGGGAGRRERLEDVQLTVEEIRGAVEEAHRRAKRTLAHVANSAGVLACLEAGVECMDHGLVLDDQAIEAMAKAGAYYVPTLWTYRNTAKQGVAGGVPEFTWRKVAAVVELHQASFKRWLKTGLVDRIGLGTDGGTTRKPLGEGMAGELEWMVAYGLTPAQALRVGTVNSARIMGVQDRFGTLESGKVADLVVVDGDALQDITVLERVRLVMKDGKVVVRDGAVL